MRRVGAVLAVALLSGCYSSPPKFWEAACRDETAIVRHETPAPEGLAVPGQGWRAFEVLAFSGAAWVEHDRYDAEGVGRYRIRLASIDKPECRQALRDSGVDPDTRMPIPRNPDAPNYSAEDACVETERLGDGMEDQYAGRGHLPLREQFEGWSAPYLLTGTGGRDARSEPNDPVWRSVVQVISRETLQPIFEAPSLSYAPKTTWFPAMRVCGASFGGVGMTEPFLAGVFATADGSGEMPKDR